MANENTDELKKDDGSWSGVFPDGFDLSEDDARLFRYYRQTYGYLSAKLLARIFLGDGEAAYIAARIIENHEGSYSPISNAADDILDLLEKSLDLGYEAPEEGPELDALNEAISTFDLGCPEKDETPVQIRFPVEFERDPVADGLTDPSEDDIDYYLYMLDQYPYLPSDLLISAFNGDSEAASRISRMLEMEADSLSDLSRPTLSKEKHGWLEVYSDSSDWKEIAEKGIRNLPVTEVREPPRDAEALLKEANWMFFFSGDDSPRKEHILHKRAYRYFRKAALMGNAKAQTSLSACYSMGIGTRKDEIKAIKWLEIAAALGDEEARTSLIFADPEKRRAADMIENHGPLYQPGTSPEGSGTISASDRSIQEEDASQQDPGTDDASLEALRPNFSSESTFYQFILLTQRGLLPLERLTDAILGTGDDPGYDAFYMAEALDKYGQTYWRLQEDLYLRSAGHGYVPAYSKLAGIYYGDGSYCDERAALKWARKGAKCGDAYCLYILAKLAMDSGVEDEISEEPFDLLTSAAEIGNGAAMYELAGLYSESIYAPLKGKTPMLNYREAREWLLKAKDAGYVVEDDVDIDYQLEVIDEDIRLQDEEDRDPEIARLRKEAENGDKQAQAELGRRLHSLASADKRHLANAEYWLEAAAEGGDAEAQYELYHLLWNNASETWEFRKAAGWLQRAAYQGLVPAAYELAVLQSDHHYDELVETDTYNAKKRLTELAENGYAPALCKLGFMALEEDDLGLIKPDYKEAVKWLEMACAHSGDELKPFFSKEKVETALKEAKDKLKEAEAQKKAEARHEKVRSFDLSLFWSEHSLQCWGILAAIGVLVFKWLYTGLGGSVFGLFGKSTPTLPVHGFAHFLL
ncbi:MAG: sel1 repeat family protein, partial [Clostridia bacterium]|nr:sel1 repeat family protein [Clostridia bacterium]